MNIEHQNAVSATSEPGQSESQEPIERRKHPRVDSIITRIQDATETVLRKSRTK